VGKFFGLTGTLVVNTFLMAIGCFWRCSMSRTSSRRWTGGAGRAVLYRAAVSDRVRAGAVFLVLFDPLMSAVFTFALFVIGSLARIYGALPESRMASVAGWRRHRLSGAEFFRFECDRPVAHGDAVPGRLILYNSLYALLYSRWP